jgi:hypothetical protein
LTSSRATYERAIADTDELFAAGGDDFFARQRATAAFDHREVFGDFVGTIDVDFQFADAVEIEHRNAVAFQAVGGGFRTGHRAVDAPLHFGQRVDEVIGGGAGAHPDNAAACIIHCGTRHSLFHFVLSHLSVVVLGSGR